MDVLKKIKVLIESMGFEVEQIKHSSKLKDDIGMDSLDIIELSVMIENFYNVTIEDNSLFSVETLDDLEIIIINKLKI